MVSIFQHTGDVRRIEHQAIEELLKQRNVVLLSCSGYSPSGEMFNLAVEDVAQMAAVSLRAEKLILMGKTLASWMTTATPSKTSPYKEAKELLPQPKGEPRNHLDAAIKAVSQGVPRAHLLSYEDDGTLFDRAVHPRRPRQHGHADPLRSAAPRQARRHQRHHRAAATLEEKRRTGTALARTAGA